MKKIVKIIILILLFINCKKQDKELVSSRTKSNVEIARTEKQANLIKSLKKLNIKWEEVHIYITAYKQEEELIVWAKSMNRKKYRKLIKYDFCNSSGELGPKRREGDRQIPEGIYEIDLLNPNSNYYLSMRISYPNTSDKIRGEKDNLGGDIYIHGGCATIGCIPITDDKIKELYILAEQAKINGQKELGISIYPFKMVKKNGEKNKEKYKQHISFWEELVPYYNSFEQTREPRQAKVNREGKYELRN